MATIPIRRPGKPGLRDLGCCAREGLGQVIDEPHEEARFVVMTYAYERVDDDEARVVVADIRLCEVGGVEQPGIVRLPPGV